MLDRTFSETTTTEGVFEAVGTAVAVPTTAMSRVDEEPSVTGVPPLWLTAPFKTMTWSLAGAVVNETVRFESLPRFVELATPRLMFQLTATPSAIART